MNLLVILNMLFKTCNVLAFSISRCSYHNLLNTRRLHRFLNQKFLLKGSKSDSTSTDNVASDGKRWLSVNLGSEKDAADAAMKKRLDEAEQWEQRQLSDDDSKTLNRLLGIEKEMLEIENEEIQSSSSSKKSSKVKATGKVVKSLQKYTSTTSSSELKGFLEMNPYICSGCGTPFQSKLETEPGFLPKEKFQEHRLKAESIKLQQDAIRILDMAGIDIDSEVAADTLRKAEIPETIIAAVRNVGRKLSPTPKSWDMNDQNYQTRVQTQQPNELTFEISNVDIRAVCICQRCYRLQQYNQIEENLRPGWSNHELLTIDRFQELLKSIKEHDAVVLCIVDLFDLKGSIVKNLKDIVGNNPIVIVCNKIDLLPKDISKERITTWIYNELQSVCELKTPRDIEEEIFQKNSDSRGQPAAAMMRNKMKSAAEPEGGILRRANIHLVSCHTGEGMEKLSDSVIAMAHLHGERIYVMGNANVGKSTFINYWIEGNSKKKSLRERKFFEKPPTITVSNLPGTTLDFLKIKLPNGVQMIDTPGLINESQLTSRLNVPELKKVIPVKPINAITLRKAEGKSVLIGGLAVIELHQGLPFFFTFFISNEVKLHPTNSSKVNEILNNPEHVGKLFDPPSSIERMEALGALEDHYFNIRGEGWEKSSTDIVISGLGWVSITGSGSCQIKVSVPQGVEVDSRLALLPFESSHTTGKFTGSRITKKSKKSGKNGKSYGWRA